MPIMHDHARNDDTAIPELTPILDHEVAIIEVGALPIRVVLDAECICITVTGDAERAGSLLAEGSHRWLERIPATDIRVDLSDIPHLTSPIAAWLGTLTSLGLPVTVVGSSRRVEVQLRLLGLGKICTIE